MEKKFTPKEQEIIDKHWKKGKHPKQCVGKCDINGIEIAECRNCSWDDGYRPCSEPYEK